MAHDHFFVIVVVKGQGHAKSAHRSAHAEHTVKAATLEFVEQLLLLVGVCHDVLLGFVGFCRFCGFCVGFCCIFGIGDGFCHFVLVDFCRFIALFGGFCLLFFLIIVLVDDGCATKSAEAHTAHAHASAKSAVKTASCIFCHKFVFSGGVCDNIFLGLVCLCLCGFVLFVCLALRLCLFGVKGGSCGKHTLDVAFKHTTACFLNEAFLLIFFLGQAQFLLSCGVALRSLKGGSAGCFLLLLKAHLIR